MLFHVMIGSNDIDRSKAFYDAVLGVLGAREAATNTAASGHKRLFYRHGDGTMFGVSEPIDGEPATVGNGSTIGFACNSPEQVREFHDVAVAHGAASIEDAPGSRDGAMGLIYLAYVRDPDGNKLCAIYRPA